MATFLTFIVLVFSRSVFAQEITPTPNPTGKFGQAVREMREINNEERTELREDHEEEIEDLKEENNKAKGQLREDAKKLMISATPEEKKILRPTIVQQKQNLTKNYTEAKKTLKESFQTKIDAFRIAARAQWATLWSSFFSKK